MGPAARDSGNCPNLRVPQMTPELPLIDDTITAEMQAAIDALKREAEIAAGIVSARKFKA